MCPVIIKNSYGKLLFLCLVCLLKRVILNIKLLVNQRVCPIMSFYIPVYSHCIPIVFLIGNATIHYSVGSLTKIEYSSVGYPHHSVENYYAHLYKHSSG